MKLSDLLTKAKKKYNQVSKPASQFSNAVKTASSALQPGGLGFAGANAANDWFRTFSTRPYGDATVFASNKLFKTPHTVPTDTNPITKAFFGPSPLKGQDKQYADTGRDTMINTFGMSPANADKYAPLIIGAGFLADAVPMGGGKKQLGQEVVPKVIKGASQAKNAYKAVKATAKSGLADDVVETVAKTGKKAVQTVGELQKQAQATRGLPLLAQFDEAMSAKNYQAGQDIANKILKNKKYQQYHTTFRGLLPKITESAGGTKLGATKLPKGAVLSKDGTRYTLGGRSYPYLTGQEGGITLTPKQYKIANPLNKALGFADQSTTPKVDPLSSLKQSVTDVAAKVKNQPLLLSPSKAPAQEVTRLSNLQKLLKSGQDMSQVTFRPAKTNDIRKAIKLGFPSGQIITQKVSQSADTLFAGARGIGRSLDPAQELLEASAKQGAKTTKAPGVYLRNAVEPNRAFRQMLGKTGDDFLELVERPLTRSKGEMARWKANLIKQTQAAVPFKAGSQESAAIQMFGENKMSRPDLVAQFGEAKAQQIEQSADFFKRTYGEILEQVNLMRKESGLKEIAKRDDYFRHLGEMNGGWLDNLTGNIFGKREAASSSIMKFRKGKDTVDDAVGNFANYIEGAGRAGFTDKYATLATDFATALKKNGADPSVVEYLKKWAREGVLGEKDIAHANKILEYGASVANNIGRRVKTNKILFNISSLVMQPANIPHAIAKVMTDDPKGFIHIQRGLTNLHRNRAAMAQSGFLADRGFAVPVSMVRGKIKQAQAVGGTALQQADMAATRLTWNMFYEQGLARGVPDAIQHADEMTKLMVAGRGIGDFAPIQRNIVGNTIFPFGVEWANSAHVWGDMAKGGKIPALIGTAAAYHAFNSLYEKVVGNRPLFDPIDAFMDAVEYTQGSEEKEKSATKAVARLVGELIQASPYTQNIFAVAYPTARMLTGGNLPPSREIFGSEDPTRFGSIGMYSPVEVTDSGQMRLKPASQIAADYILPGGGNQLKKTIEGTLAGVRGYTQSARGNLMHEVSQDPLNKLRMATFGQWSSPETKEFFDSESNRSLTKDQAAIYKSLPENQRSQYMTNVQGINKTKNATGKKEDNWFTKLFGGDKQDTMAIPKPDATLQEKKAFNDMTKQMLNEGLVPDKERLAFTYFGKKSPASEDLTLRQDGYQKLHTLMTSEDYSDEQKEALLIASGAKHYDYYQAASASLYEKREHLVSMASEYNNNRPKLMEELFNLQRKVGGKAFMHTGDLDYLYDMGLISNDEKKFINNVKYDEITEQFYFDRDYKGFGSGGSGGEKLTQAKVQTLLNKLNATFKYEEPKRRSMFTSDLFKKPASSKVIQPRKLRRGRKTQDAWFTPY